MDTKLEAGLRWSALGLPWGFSSHTYAPRWLLLSLGNEHHSHHPCCLMASLVILGQLLLRVPPPRHSSSCCQHRGRRASGLRCHPRPLPGHSCVLSRVSVAPMNSVFLRPACCYSKFSDTKMVSRAANHHGQNEAHANGHFLCPQLTASVCSAHHLPMCHFAALLLPGLPSWHQISLLFAVVFQSGHSDPQNLPK